MTWTPEQVRRHKAAAKAVANINNSVAGAVDNFTDSVETLLTAIAQRPMSEAQMDRLAMVLQRGERDLLRRFTSCAVADGQPASARPSTRSRTDRAA